MRVAMLAFLVFLGSCLAVAQGPNVAKADGDPDAAARVAQMQQQGRALLDQALREAAQLGPENQIVVKTRAIEGLWTIDPGRARAAVPEIVAAFTEAGSGTDASDEDAMQRRQRISNLRSHLIQSMARYDPQLALDTLIATRPATFAGLWAERQEQSLETTLASQAAAKNPALALQMAEKSVKTLSWELFNVVSMLNVRDPQSARKLAGEIYDELRTRDLNSDFNAANFALNWLRMSPPPDASAGADAASFSSGRPSAAKDLMPKVADLIATAALQAGATSQLLGNLPGVIDTLAAYAPARAQQLRQRLGSLGQSQRDQYQSFVRAGQTGGVDAQLKIAADASPEQREQLYNQAAFSAMGQGNYLRARQIAMDNISDPNQRAQALLNIMRGAAMNAAAQGDLALARAICSEIASPAQRAEALAQAVRSAGKTADPQVAQSILNEAAALLPLPPNDGRQLNAELQVAQAFAAINPAHASEMLGAMLERINGLIAAAAELDGFVGPRTFADGEMDLQSGMLYGMTLRPYVDALATVAQKNPKGAKAVADGLGRPELRALAHVEMGQRLLQAAAAPPNQPTRTPVVGTTGGVVGGMH